MEAWETRRERDERVAVNVPADLLPLWERTRASFHGSPEERFDAFMQYAHDHESDAVAAAIDLADRKLAQLIAAHESEAA